MKIGLVQYNPVWEDKQKNKEKLLAMLDNSSAECSLLIFPEMTLTGFTMLSAKFAEELNGESVSFFKDTALNRNSDVIAGLIEKDGSGIYNTLIHINKKGELKKSYRKIHPFSYSTEDKHYNRGSDTVITEIDDNNETWETGLSICYDLRFPELYRHYGKQKVQLIVNIANWPDTRIEHWRTLLKARAIENQCYVAGVNRTGKDPGLVYNGYSSIFDPMGKEIITCFDEEKIITTDLSLLYAEEVQTRLPFLNDIFLIK
jgi:predicted amidohydrolase